ncbi:uncharacterized protein LOC116661181 isoform X2 [Camelus ferus]|uniref:Uncharacterized protein LOC116661181 isoform X2 n=1 Tax=Camelus ferus TaxID=419612 RepID=A0A8B8SE13_CAMFR|nr:uncharacterized protein LOC116661181 isoform X2 [Camelus ferus]
MLASTLSRQCSARQAPSSRLTQACSHGAGGILRESGSSRGLLKSSLGTGTLSPLLNSSGQGTTPSRDRLVEDADLCWTQGFGSFPLRMEYPEGSWLRLADVFMCSQNVERFVNPGLGSKALNYLHVCLTVLPSSQALSQ